ncbi:hypothetical protein [Micromonospora sp. L32]
MRRLYEIDLLRIIAALAVMIFKGHFPVLGVAFLLSNSNGVSGRASRRGA